MHFSVLGGLFTHETRMWGKPPALSVNTASLHAVLQQGTYCNVFIAQEFKYLLSSFADAGGLAKRLAFLEVIDHVIPLLRREKYYCELC